ncbi:MAG: FtsW/RodA/SpoVE family cell cycle protein, partial [Chloroflexota bacterium]
MMRSPGSQPRPTQPRPTTRSSQSAAHAPDYLLLTSVIVLCVFGLIAVYSSSYALGSAQFNDANYFIKRQVVSLAIGAVAMATAMVIDYRILMRLSPLIMLVALIGLAGVLVPGFSHSSNGAARWINIGPLPPLQPSEFAKLAVLIYL